MNHIFAKPKLIYLNVLFHSNNSPKPKIIQFIKDKENKK